jgi:hypothetical protein
MAVSTELHIKTTHCAYRCFTSAGSQYSSTRDLRTWGAAILRSGQLEPVVTRRWMKPAAVTGQWSVDVGVSLQRGLNYVIASVVNNDRHRGRSTGCQFLQTVLPIRHALSTCTPKTAIWASTARYSLWMLIISWSFRFLLLAIIQTLKHKI